VLDDNSSRIIGRFLSIPDLSQEGILFIENLTKKRKKFKNLNGIYLIAPTVQNLRLIEEDYKRSVYGSIHICTTRSIDDEAMQRLAGMSMVAKIQTLKELNMDFHMHNMSTFR
jgi:hypothetical protein